MGMINREMVIKELESYELYAKALSNLTVEGWVILDALALLKEKEAKTGHWISVNDGDVVAIDNDGFPERACFCSQCKKHLIASDEYAVYRRYCPFCGVKMEGR